MQPVADTCWQAAVLAMGSLRFVWLVRSRDGVADEMENPKYRSYRDPADVQLYALMRMQFRPLNFFAGDSQVRLLQACLVIGFQTIDALDENAVFLRL